MKHLRRSISALALSSILCTGALASFAVGCGTSETGDAKAGNLSDDSEAESSDLSTPDDDEASRNADSAFDAAQKMASISAYVGAVSCVSKADDGSTIDGDELPVGEGRWLECKTNPVPSRLVARTALLSGPSAWCRIGKLDRAWVDPHWEKASHDPHFVTTEVVSSPPDAPWTLIGRRNGEQVMAPHDGGWVQAVAIYRIVGGHPSDPTSPCE